MSDKTMLKIGISALIIGSVAYSGLFHLMNKYFNLEDDNEIEQSLEKVIEHYTDFEIDLTPGI
jgi:hypothetical protein